jgi:hypothetical protein
VLKLEYNEPLSNFAFKFNLRRYTMDLLNELPAFNTSALTVGRCRLTLSKPVLKPPGTQRLKLNCHMLLSTFAFIFNLRRYTTGPSWRGPSPGQVAYGKGRRPLNPAGPLPLLPFSPHPKCLFIAKQCTRVLSPHPPPGEQVREQAQGPGTLIPEPLTLNPKP